MRHFRLRSQWLLVFKNIVKEKKKHKSISKSRVRVNGELTL